MELETSASSAPHLESHPLGQDIVRAFLGVMLGFLSGGALAAVTGTLNPLYVVWAAVAGPFLFLALILGHRSRVRRVFAARLSGAFIGWSLFVGLFWFWDRGSQWFFSGRGFVLIIGPPLAAGFIAAGEVLGDVVLRMTRAARFEGTQK
jgi:hypothetical protein